MTQTSAPTRLDFAGAPTDVEPFKTREGGYIVNASLGIRAQVSVSPLEDSSEVVVISKDLGIEERFTSVETIDDGGDLQLVKAATRHVHPDRGIRITTNTNAPRGSGLGASAALAIALVSALRTIKGENPTIDELVADALYVENVILGNINGGQDQYAAALGGFHALAFGPGLVAAHPLQPSPEFLRLLEERSLLCYSGDSRVSGEVLDQIMADYRAGDRHTAMLLRAMKQFARDTEQALIEDSFDDLCDLVRAVGKAQRSLHPSMTPPAVRRVMQIGSTSGGLAAKMAGAGGGGCVYFLCEPERKGELTGALESEGIQILPVQFPRSGLEAGAGLIPQVGSAERES